MKKSPIVSVLMPAYNAERYLKESVESILNQSFSDFEFIIIDDGSTDRTPEILSHYRDRRVVYVGYESNKGLIHTLNHGLRLARGKFIARQDADDVSLPNRFATQVTILNEQSNLVIVGSAYYVIDEAGNHLRVLCPPMTDTAIRWQTLFHNSFVHTSVMLRVDTIRQRGLHYNPQHIGAEDYGLWSQILNYGQGLNIAIPLVKYRRHCNQVSNLTADIQRKNADRISQANLERLGLPVSQAALRVLRDWQLKFPRPLRGDEMALYRETLPIFELFEKQPKINAEVVRSLRQKWVKHTLAGTHISQWKDLLTSGLLENLLHTNAALVAATLVTQPPKRIISRIRRSLCP